MQRCTPRPNAACGFGNRSSTISSGSGNDAGSWLHIAYDRNMRSPSENSNPATSQSCVIGAPAALRGCEVAQELLGGEVRCRSASSTRRGALVGVGVEPVEAPASSDVVVSKPPPMSSVTVPMMPSSGSELVHHRGVEQRGDHPRPRLGLADLHVLGEPPTMRMVELDHAVPKLGLSGGVYTCMCAGSQ